MIGYVYKITNSINKKIYVGETFDITQRIRQHKSNAKLFKKESQTLYDDIREYGFDNFNFRILRKITADSKDELKKKLKITEEEKILKLGAYDPKIGYNFINHGSKDHKWSEESRNKLSESRKKNGNSEYNKQKTSEGVLISNIIKRIEASNASYYKNNKLMET